MINNMIENDDYKKSMRELGLKNGILIKKGNDYVISKEFMVYYKNETKHGIEEFSTRV